LQISGDSMAPVVADGASVAYATGEEEIQQLDGKLVVAWLENQPVVRWFQNCGRFALLRAENPNSVPQQVLVDMDDTKHRPRFRRVLCINTPH
jgi:phage repressor protein C with HTH and peptisase S24 domain